MRRWLLTAVPLVRLAGVAGLAVLAVVLGTAAPASAHNQLTSSDPDDGARLEQGPERVRLTFLASLDNDGAELAVTGPDGASAVRGEPAFDGTDVTIPVRAPLAGAYQVSYRVLSTDGHWAEGSISFTVTVGESAPASPSASPSPSPSPAEVTPSPLSQAGDAGSDTFLPWWGWLLLALGAAGAAGAGTLGWRRARRSAG